jgi:hypothetical protein
MLVIENEPHVFLGNPQTFRSPIRIGIDNPQQPEPLGRGGCLRRHSREWVVWLQFVRFVIH